MVKIELQQVYIAGFGDNSYLEEGGYFHDPFRGNQKPELWVIDKITYCIGCVQLDIDCHKAGDKQCTKVFTFYNPSFLVEG